MIAGFPGFSDKLWMIDRETGYWQGIYQFDDTETIELYKRSFVLGIMNKRAIEDTVVYQVFSDEHLDDIVSDKLVK